MAESKVTWSRINFWDRVDADIGCWLWKGQVNDGGYGRLSKRYAHRIAYEECVGPIPPGLQIDHLCRNTRCVNPGHLELVTPAENMARSMAPTSVYARTNRCKRGHSLDDAYVYPTGHSRDCRPCRIAYSRDYYAKKRGITKVQDAKNG